jgi:hypothetical protein
VRYDSLELAGVVVEIGEALVSTLPSCSTCACGAATVMSATAFEQKEWLVVVVVGWVVEVVFVGFSTCK